VCLCVVWVVAHVNMVGHLCCVRSTASIMVRKCMWQCCMVLLGHRLYMNGVFGGTGYVSSFTIIFIAGFIQVWVLLISVHRTGTGVGGGRSIGVDEKKKHLPTYDRQGSSLLSQHVVGTKWQRLAKNGHCGKCLGSRWQCVVVNNATAWSQKHAESSSCPTCKCIVDKVQALEACG